MSIAEKLQTIAENEQKVFEAGKQAQYNKFWDGLQNFGNRTRYSSTFQEWTDYMFYPKYDIIYGASSNGLFHGSKINNIKSRLEECGVKLIMQSTSLQSFCNGCSTEELPILDFSALASTQIVSMQYSFSSASNLKKVHIKNATLAYLQDPFLGCKSLESLIFENCTILATGFSSLRLAASTKLSKESLINLFNALADINGTATKTVELGATNLAKLTDNEKAIAMEKGWTLA